ncbi:alpha/beta hydrolase family protein [Pedobacter cryoconitis]|uniref:Prolyl oligopeptidase family protein n=1 Tax=Pedobacter cryoconitis TaxID=188932 RepID=A0A327SDN9_9SPHI|nr:prolyl oligopeptidase family serine peptidase [Pedobacter cryoconitis]RAJ27216.1 prolyl oligopeptidase family protein [Pedobacter cryoconitis]
MFNIRKNKNAEDCNLKEFEAISNGIKIQFYIHNLNLGIKKGLLLYIQGSGPIPLWAVSKNSSALTFNLHTYPAVQEQYYFVIISKPGLSFHEIENISLYHELLSLQFRVFQAESVLNWLTEQEFIDRKRVLIVGHSEGADVAAKLTSTNKGITHLAYLASGGISQYFDYILSIRKQQIQGHICEEKANTDLDSILKNIQEITKNPTSTQDFWLGHTYLRWSSFSTPPIGSLLQIDVPIFVGIGSKDQIVHLESADYIITEFSRIGKKNLTYKIYKNSDHGFSDISNTKSTSLKHRLLDDILEWTKN